MIYHMIRTAIILACLQFSCFVSWAADDAGSFVAYGFGNRLCSEWLESRTRNDAETVEMTAWTLGFISAYNKYVHKGINVAGQLNAGDIHTEIDKHCTGRPFDSLSFAASAVIEQQRSSDRATGMDGLLDLFESRTLRK